jgi:hypothetical protein
MGGGLGGNAGGAGDGAELGFSIGGTVEREPRPVGRLGRREMMDDAKYTSMMIRASSGY